MRKYRKLMNNKSKAILLLLYLLIRSIFVRFTDQEEIWNISLKSDIVINSMSRRSCTIEKSVTYYFAQVCVKLHPYLWLPIFWTQYFLLTNKNIFLIMFCILHSNFCRIILINEGMILWTRNKNEASITFQNSCSMTLHR